MDVTTSFTVGDFALLKAEAVPDAVEHDPVRRLMTVEASDFSPHVGPHGATNWRETVSLVWRDGEGRLQRAQLDARLLAKI